MTDGETVRGVPNTHLRNAANGYLDEDRRTKLTEEQARAIFADKRKRSVIAREYGLHVVTVRHIQLGIIWKHLRLVK